MQGIQIYIIPWSETQLAMGLDSRHAQSVLSMYNCMAVSAVWWPCLYWRLIGWLPTSTASMHESNIHFMRHPLASPIKWSHHQKTIVIDQSVAFIGGLDLAFGRYDSMYHTHTALRHLLPLTEPAPLLQRSRMLLSIPTPKPTKAKTITTHRLPNSIRFAYPTRI
jgi:phosphatidylserine/phosphatidylglycerophosphate/cardiolipin synthase-like enzyme